MDLPLILLTGGDPQGHRTEFFKVLAAEQPPRIFKYNKSILLYHPHLEESEIFESSETTKLGKSLITHRIVRLTKNEGVEFAHPQYFYFDLLGASMFADSNLFMEVQTIERAPAYTLIKEGFKPVSQGFNPENKKLFIGNGPSLQIADPRLPILRSIFSALRPQEEIDRAHLICYLVSCFARSFCSIFPALVLDATAQMAGKSNTAAAIVHVISGRTEPPIIFQADESRNEFRIGGYTNRPGPTPIIFDNIRPKPGRSQEIRNSFISSATTNPTVAADVKLKPTAPLFLPIFILTMNGARVESDLASRCFFVRLLPSPDGKPLDLTPNPLGIAQQNRMDILGEINYIYKNMTYEKVTDRQIRMFEWVNVMTSIAKFMGLAIDLSSSRAKSYDNMFIELFEHMFSESAQEPGKRRLDELLQAILDYPGRARELTDELRRDPAITSRRRNQKFREFLQQRVLGHKFRALEREWQFCLEGDTVEVHST